MFRSMTFAQQRVTQLLNSYYTWATGPAVAQLGKPECRLVNVRDLRGTVAGYLNIASKIAEDPEFSTLPDEMQEDITDMIAEMTAALAEIDETADPETAWRELPNPDKAMITAATPVNVERRGRLKDRVTMQLRRKPKP